MLKNLITNLMVAKDQKEREKAFRRLERVGVDRYTACVLVRELKAEEVSK